MDMVDPNTPPEALQRRLAELEARAARAEEAEQALRAREAELQSIFLAAPTGIGMVIRRVIKMVNDRLCRMVGYSGEELLGRDSRLIYPTDQDYDYVGRAKYDQIRAHGVGTVETRWRRKDGVVLDVLLSSAPIDPARWELGVIFTALDITDRKRAEAAERRTQAMLAGIMNSVPQGIFWKDREGRFLGCNEVFARAVDLDGPTRIVGLTDFDVVQDPAEAEAYRAEDREVIETGQPRRHLIGPRRSADGSHFWIDTSKVPLLDEQGRVGGVLGVFDDVTERLQLEAQLRQAQKMEALGQLAGGVAHDFNNLLTAILGNVEAALGRLEPILPSPDPALEALSQVQRSARRAADLTRQLLTFSRRQVAQARVLDLNPLLVEMEKLLRRLLAENIDLRMELGAGLPPLRADPGQVEQMVMNLAVNARDAMPAGGRLLLATSLAELDQDYVRLHPEARPGPHVLLTVADTGTGMDSGTVERIFEPFFTTKGPGQGTGLGLATVYGIVKQVGGHINVQSEPGRGTTFRVHLPAAKGEPAAPPPPPPPAEEPRKGQGTILLCEDDEAVRELTAEMLRSAGYKVLAAGGGDEALALAAAHAGPIRLLVTDVIMPGRNGPEVALALQATRPGLPTLFISGYAANVLAGQGIHEENLDFLAKPFTRLELLARVWALLERRAPLEPGQ